MRRLIAYPLKAMAVTASALAFTAVSLIPNAQPAWAPEMVGLEIKALRAVGYEVCEPVIGQLPDDVEQKGVVADASVPGDPGVICEIRFSDLLETEDLNWVAHHEACHLATVNDIYADPASADMEDPAHEHPLFSACLDHGPADRGGY